MVHPLVHSWVTKLHKSVDDLDYTLDRYSSSRNISYDMSHHHIGVQEVYDVDAAGQ